MTNDEKKNLEQQLWNIANELRGKMNADEFRDYCLGFIFFKYLSEKLHQYANFILKEDGIDFTNIDEESEEGQEMLEAIKEESVAQLGYFLKPSELFSSIAKRGAHKVDDEDEDVIIDNFILNNLTKVLNSIERSTMGTESEDDFDHLFEDLDLTSTKLGRTEKAKNALIAKILVHLDNIDFGLRDSESDILGDAYEYLIGQFASGAGKKAGEFYTPQAVSTILARIVTTGKRRIKSVYDPTCGSGSLLLRVAREVEHVGDFYGQEMNRTTYNLARMNMILHGVHYRNFDLKQEDTLENPQHADQKFEAVVANPPFSTKWSANKLFESDDRFSQYGKLAPGSKADFAFVQHMLYHLDENGTMAIVLPHGALFRGAAEGHIRHYLIEEQNWLDAVIGLPANIFYGTSIPTCILVFKKCRENSEDILFIEASAYFEKGKNQNHLRMQDIDKIVETYRQRQEEDKYSYRAPLSEIEENDYNLNIPRYIDIFGDETKIDIDSVTELLRNVQDKLNAADKKIAKSCAKLKVPEPEGCNITLLIAYKRGMIQKIFTQEVRFKNDAGTSFPDWIDRKLGDVFDWVRTNNLSREMLSSSGVIQNIHYGDIHTKYSTQFYQETAEAPFIRNMYETGYIKDEDYCKEGDLVIADASEDYEDIGKAIEIMSVSPNSLVAGLHTYIARPKGEFVSGFAGYLFQSQALRKQIKRTAQGVSVLGIAKRYLENLNIPQPSLGEQNKIANFLLALDRKIDAIANRATRIENYKNNNQ